VKFHEIVLDDKPYQQITIAQGSAPLTVIRKGTGYAMLYIGESILQAATTECGAYLIKTGEDIPDEVHIIPFLHPLTNQPVPPDARYIGTVSEPGLPSVHLVLGNPKGSALIT
jgi:hypothetical protein